MKGGFEGEQGRGDRDQQTGPQHPLSVFSLRLELATPPEGPPHPCALHQPSSKGLLLSLVGSAGIRFHPRAGAQALGRTSFCRPEALCPLVGVAAGNETAGSQDEAPG